MFEDLIESIEATVALRPQQPKFDKGIPFVILKEHGEQVVRSLEHLMPKPADTRGTAQMDDLNSFITYVNDRKNSSSRIFATLKNAFFSAVLDFHGEAGPEWCRDIAEFNPEPKPEWKIWQSKNKQNISQADFAEFIEDNLQHIVEPDGAYLLEVAKNLVAKKSVDFKSGINLDNGDVQLQYEETTEAKSGTKGSLTIPSEISIGLVPFEGAPAYAIKARLRYRINDGKLYFIYKLQQPEKVWEDAVKAAAKRIQDETKLPVSLGAYTRPS